MIPTFVIGLREGLEAALIVGIVAAFLVKEGRSDQLRLMWIGVAAAVGVCAAVGIGLEILNTQLPQRQQEMLETVVGMVAVGMITFMVVWMCRHSANLKNELHSQTSDALATGSAYALVTMAFFAVIREGFETAVFLLAAFDSALDPAMAALGAICGIVLSCAIGYGIYRGGVRIDLARFFRFTAGVLVLVAAGLVAASFHTAWEAGIVNFGQTQVLDLTWLVQPGTVSSAIFTGMLGLQPRPTQVETIGYLLYAVPMLAYVFWPRTPQRQRTIRSQRRGTSTQPETP